MYPPRYIQYLNLPKIPQHIIDQLERDPTVYHQVSTVEGPYTWSDYDTKLLNVWCRENICSEMYFGLQIMTGNLPLHLDTGTKIKINYIIDPGGTDVITSFYDNDQVTLLDSYCIEPNRWHIFKADTHHQVTNIQPGQYRFGVTGRIF